MRIPRRDPSWRGWLKLYKVLLYKDTKASITEPWPCSQVEDATEILIRHNVWGCGPKFGPVHNFELPTVIADAVPQATHVFSLASIGHVTGHMVSHMVPIARCRLWYWKIRTVNKSEQSCNGFLGLLKFLCSVLIIFSLVWHAKDFAQVKIANGKKCIEPKQSKRDRDKTSAFVKHPTITHKKKNSSC